MGLLAFSACRSVLCLLALSSSHCTNPARSCLKCGEFYTIEDEKCIGSGPGSDKRGTGTKGHKDAQSRSGYKRKRRFEAGQLPLQRSIPGYGIKQPSRVTYKPINLGQLQQLIEKTKISLINADVLRQHGLVGRNDRYTILGQGVLQFRVDVDDTSLRSCISSSLGKVSGIGLATHSRSQWAPGRFCTLTRTTTISLLVESAQWWRCIVYGSP